MKRTYYKMIISGFKISQRTPLLKKHLPKAQVGDIVDLGVDGRFKLWTTGRGLQSWKQMCKTAECPSLRNDQIYESAKTAYCKKCSKVHDPTWYDKYKATKLCKKCKKLFYIEGYKYCTGCLETETPEDYKKWKQNLKCASPTCNQNRCDRVCDSKTTFYCANCAKTKDVVWYKAHHTQNMCECGNFRSKYRINGRVATYCVRCSKTLDVEWYKGYAIIHRCQHSKDCPRLGVNGTKICKTHTPGFVSMKVGVSKGACQFMDEYEKFTGQPIQHVHLNPDTTWTGYEKRVSSVGMNVIKVDGWIGPNIVIEYHGDFFHGHERFNPEEMKHVSWCNLWRTQLSHNVAHGQACQSW